VNARFLRVSRQAACFKRVRHSDDVATRRSTSGSQVSLLPKLTCPMCWPAYAALFTTLGLGFLISARYLFAVTAALLLLSAGTLAFRARERRGYGPASLGLLGAAMTLFGKFQFESLPSMYSGFSFLSPLQFGMCGRRERLPSARSARSFGLSAV
jgi:hypothetical protein